MFIFCSTHKNKCFFNALVAPCRRTATGTTLALVLVVNVAIKGTPHAHAQHRNPAPVQPRAQDPRAAPELAGLLHHLHRLVQSRAADGRDPRHVRPQQGAGLGAADHERGADHSRPHRRRHPGRQARAPADVRELARHLGRAVHRLRARQLVRDAGGDAAAARLRRRRLRGRHPHHRRVVPGQGDRLRPGAVRRARQLRLGCRRGHASDPCAAVRRRGRLALGDRGNRRDRDPLCRGLLRLRHRHAEGLDLLQPEEGGRHGGDEHLRSRALLP